VICQTGTGVPTAHQMIEPPVLTIDHGRDAAMGSAECGIVVSKFGPNMELVTGFFPRPRSHFFVFGPRGTGKSVWTQQAFPDAPRIGLLDSAERARTRRQPLPGCLTSPPG